MNFEIELRYEVCEKESLEKFLASLNFISKKRIVDTYFDTHDAHLLQQGIY